MMWKKWMGAFLTLALCVFLGTASSAEAAAKKAKEKPARVELVMVLDKSGSMAGLESDTIGGFNAMIEKEKKLDAKVNVTTVLFSDVLDTIYDREDIRRIKPLTDKEYEVGGTTALLDALGSVPAFPKGAAAFLVSSAYSIIYARGARRAEHWKPPWATLCIIASKATI